MSVCVRELEFVPHHQTLTYISLSLITALSMVYFHYIRPRSSPSTGTAMAQQR
jgi:hypothetical protein